MSNNKFLMVIIIVSWLASGLIGWTVCKSVKDKEVRQLNNLISNIIVTNQKANVDHALKTLEISLQGKDPKFIARALGMAKEFSADAEGYGAERIQEIEIRIKK